MPKAVREVKSFNLGIVTSADDNDLKVDAAVFSENIDPNSSQGRLQGRPKDSLITVGKSRGPFVFTTPDSSGDGALPREVDVKLYNNSGVQLVEDKLYGDIPFYEIKLYLVGKIPSANVTVKVDIAGSDFSEMSGYLKANDTANTSGYPNNGEFVEKVFTSSNYETVQSVYLIPQSTSFDATIEIPVNITLTSTDSNWTHSDRDKTRIISYVSNVIPGVIIKRSTYRLAGVEEGIMGEFKLDVKLTENPQFDSDTSEIEIKFRSNNIAKLYAHKTTSETQPYMKILKFTNATWNTYQTLEPFGVDDGVKNGNSVYYLVISALTNGSPRFEALEDNIANSVRHDDGNFITNDFIHAGISSWPVVVHEAGTGTGGGDGDDDGGDDDGSEDKGWKP